jgi:hypothetical protein
MDATQRETERIKAGDSIIRILQRQAGLDVLPARVEHFLAKCRPYTFTRVGSGKNRSVFSIEHPEFGDLRLVIKLGGATATEYEYTNTQSYPEDFPRIYGHCPHVLISERADIYPDTLPEDHIFRKRYLDIGDNVGTIDGRIVMLDGGVPCRCCLKQQKHERLRVRMSQP